MASSVAITEPVATDRGLTKITFTWVAHTDGVVTGVETDSEYTGKVEAIVTIPDGSAAPTSGYDIFIEDEDDNDVLAAAGVGLSDTATEQTLSASLGVVYRSKLTFRAADAGSGGEGVAHLYLR